MFVAILGFTNVEIIDVNDFFNLVRERSREINIQFFDANFIAGWEHIYFAALNALYAFKNKKNISNSLAVESLLFASAQRQIKKAVKMLGIGPESSQVAVLIMAETEQKVIKTLEIVSDIITGLRDDSILDLTEKKIEDIKHLFGISDLECRAVSRKEGFEKEALIDLVVERVALLST